MGNESNVVNNKKDLLEGIQKQNLDAVQDPKLILEKLR